MWWRLRSQVVQARRIYEVHRGTAVAYIVGSLQYRMTAASSPLSGCTTRLVMCTLQSKTAGHLRVLTRMASLGQAPLLVAPTDHVALPRRQGHLAMSCAGGLPLNAVLLSPHVFPLPFQAFLSPPLASRVLPLTSSCVLFPPGLLRLFDCCL